VTTNFVKLTDKEWLRKTANWHTNDNMLL